MREPTKGGMRAARPRGKHVGRPRRLTPGQMDLAMRLIEEGQPTGVVAKLVDVNRAMLFRSMNGTK